MTSIPLAETASFGAAVRRTLAVRVALGLALGLSAAAAAVSAAKLEVGETALFAPGASGVLVLDLSSSIDAAPPREIEGVLRHLVAAGGRAGLVLFSDVAYEALPPSASAQELRPYVRFFHRPGPAVARREYVPPPRLRNRRFVTPWSRSFRGGTRISSGLEVARLSLREHPGGPRDVLLVSDLNDSLFDISQLSASLLTYRREKIRLRVVPLNATEENREFFRHRLGRGAFVRREAFDPSSAALASRTTAGSTPRLLIGLTVLIALVLGLNELWCGRLAWRHS